jgi:hypothetical protein
VPDGLAAAGRRSHLQRNDRHAIKTPLAGHPLIIKFEFDRRRTNTEIPPEVEDIRLQQLRRRGIGWCHQQSVGQVDIARAQGREYLGQTRRIVVDLKSRRRKVAQHGIIARLVGIIDRRNRSPDQLCQF